MNVSKVAFLAVCVCLISRFGATSFCAQDPTPEKRSATEAASPFLIRGTVVDETGSPVANAEVVDDATSKDLPIARTDAAGNFTLNYPSQRYGVVLLARDADGRRQAFLEPSVNGKSHEAPLRIVLRAAREIAVAVNDGKGRPVANANVSVGRSQFVSRIRFQQKTDADGKAILRIPTDMPVAQIIAVKRGWGLDYFRYRTASAVNGGRIGMSSADRSMLPPFDGKPTTFVLSGVHKTRIHLVDRHRRPLSGVSLRASFERARRGGPLSSYGIDELQATTNQMGIAEFDAIPVEAEKNFTISSGTSDYFFEGKPDFDPAARTSEFTIVALRQPVLRVRVTFPDGRPASGASVSFACRQYGGGGHGFGHAACDADGTCGDFTFRFGAHCVVTASSGHFAAPMVACIAHPEEPMAPVNLILQPACRVYGTITAGKERRPVPHEGLTLYQRYDGEAKQPDNQHSATHPEVVSEDIPHQTSTDVEGRFEFFVASGRYSLDDGPVVSRRLIGPDCEERAGRWGEGANEFRIQDKREVEVHLHHDQIDPLVLDGRIVMKSEPQRAVPNAIVQGFSTDFKHLVRFKAICGAAGKFHADSRSYDLCDILIEAAPKDRSLSGIVRVRLGDPMTIIPVEPAASVRGRLIDPATGHPVINGQVDCGVKVDHAGRGFELAFRRTVNTNAKGEFELDGLAPGWTFSLYTLVDQTPVLSKWSHVADVTPKNSAPVDLGDVPPQTADRK